MGWDNEGYSGGDWGVATRLGKGEFTNDGEGNTALSIGLVAGYTLKDTAELALGFRMDNAYLRDEESPGKF